MSLNLHAMLRMNKTLISYQLMQTWINLSLYYAFMCLAVVADLNHHLKALWILPDHMIAADAWGRTPMSFVDHTISVRAYQDMAFQEWLATSSSQLDKV